MKIVLFTAFLCIGLLVNAQNPPITFHHLTVENGLNDGHIQMIGQDKLGYLWFGTLGALNRYDGRQMRTYAYRSGDSTSRLSGLIFCMATDSLGKLYFGFDNGLAEFDYAKNAFNRIESMKDLAIYRAIVSPQNQMFFTTPKGLVKYDPLSKKAVFYFKTDSLLQGSFNECVLKNQKLYIGTDNGVVVFDITTEKATRLATPILRNLKVTSLCFDDKNRLWLTATKPKILRLSADFKDYDVYDRFISHPEEAANINYFILKDKKNRIWISSKINGIMQYDAPNDSLIKHLHDEQKPWTPSTDVHLAIFCDKDGAIWAGSAEGVNYFHPDKNLFETIMTFNTEVGVRNRRLARTVTEDKDKNLWFGTPDGLVKYDVKTKTYREWRNEDNATPILTSNSIRHVFCDDNNDIWIVTPKGLNFYNHTTDKITVLTPENGFPKVNYMRVTRSSSGNLWLTALGGDGYYEYNPKTKILRGISQYPQLQRFANLEGWSFLEDSKGRYWFGFNEKGLGMYDPATQQTYHWMSEGKNAIAGVIIFDIKEDRNGLIWIATNHGVTQIDVAKNDFRTFNTDNGLSSNSTSCLAVDARNRVWVGTGKGLMMFDSSRQSLTHFGLQDGLPSLTFTEFAGYTTSNGDIIMPTQKGYIRFNPLRYTTEKQSISFYVNSFSAANIEHELVEVDGKLTIDLDAHENSFSFNLVALNYFNPSQTWYAYRLEGFETEWHITQDPHAVYTNIQGGDYTFRYKSSLNVKDWEVPEKKIAIHVSTVFYKTWWFWILGISLMGSLLFGYLRNRSRQEERVASLQNKAQLLEKEKAIMQYEGLKQQLNPHFLFNSLTSLSSLIQIDTKVANVFLESLSKTYRYILKSSESETVALRDEVKFAQNFVLLQKTRFEDGLFINFDVHKEDWDKKVVPVTLQNLIENAIKHNIVDTESPLIIDIFTENTDGGTTSREHREGGSWLVVRNNLQKKNYVETSNKRGLDNLTNLYHYIINKPVEIIETADSFTVKIPLI